jgi:hypothetical protein
LVAAALATASDTFKLQNFYLKHGNVKRRITSVEKQRRNKKRIVEKRVARTAIVEKYKHHVHLATNLLFKKYFFNFSIDGVEFKSTDLSVGVGSPLYNFKFLVCMAEKRYVYRMKLATSLFFCEATYWGANRNQPGRLLPSCVNYSLLGQTSKPRVVRYNAKIFATPHKGTSYWLTLKV